MTGLYRPEPGDLWFRKEMLSDPDTMSYNDAWGGTIPFPEEDWTEWYDHWVLSSGGKRYYRYVTDGEGSFVGEIAYHYDPDRGIHLADVIIHAPERGKGYGGQALDMLCSAAREAGIKFLYDDIAIDNPAVKMFLGHGFTEEYRTDEIIMLRKDL